MTTWTTTDMPDQRGRTVVVTGATSGLGAQAARALGAAGATVILACRDPGRARAVAGAVAGRTEVRELDLADLGSVRAFAAGLGDVDALINNAGVMAVPRGATADGFEQHIGTNHLGPFALTGLLAGRVRDRVVTVTSGLHLLGRVDVDDLNWERRRYQRWLAYAQSKLANLLFAYELQRRLRVGGGPTISVAAHPGVTATEGQRRDTSLQGKILAGGSAQSPELGVLPILYAATARVDGGSCIGPDGFLQRGGHPTVVRTSRRSHDTSLAALLWERSVALTGVRHPSARQS